MGTLLFLSRFMYRIRYKLLIGILSAALLSVYLTSYIPKKYSVTTAVFTGISSNTPLTDLEAMSDWNASKNAHDNIIYLVQSKSTLEKVSAKLLAQHLIYGDANEDNNYLQAKNYRHLLEIVPKDVLDLVDRSSVDKTAAKFAKYKTENRDNFIYAIFNWDNPYYSYTALKTITVVRKESSDMLEISYQSDDAGITTSTILLLTDELSSRYEGLLLHASNDVVSYFEAQLKLAAQKLDVSESDLVAFNSVNNIVNYEEQTKHLSAMKNEVETRYEQVMMENASSKALVLELERQMETRARLVRENEVFLNTLAEIATLNGQIAEIEIFGSSGASDKKLAIYKEQLSDANNKIKGITTSIDTYKISKEGVAIKDMVVQWLDAVVKQEKSKAELTVIKSRLNDIQKEFDFYSPVGPNLDRKDRTVRVNEEIYLTILHQLGDAKLRQKNILLDAGTLQVVTPPEIPLIAMPRHRGMIIAISILATALFIVGLFLILELLDRTICDGYRAHRLTGLRVVAAFALKSRRRYRLYNQQIQNIAATYLTNILNRYLKRGERMVVNVISFNGGDGKSTIAANIIHHWAEVGFVVKYVSYKRDFDSASKAFLEASTVGDLVDLKQSDFDILVVEYAPLTSHWPPSALLAGSTVNLIVLDAQKAWRSNDSILLDHLKESVGGDSLMVCLNKADRDAVEQYTGQLPPYTKFRKCVYKIFNLGLTAKE